MADQFGPDQLARSAETCDICSGASWSELYTARDRLGNSSELFPIARCNSCGVLRTRPALSESELERFYPRDYWSEKQQPTEEWIHKSQLEKIRFLTKCGLAGGRILDVGCGAGWFLRALEENCWDRFGVETGHSAVRAARTWLGERCVVESTLLNADFQASSFDVVSFWSSLEHTNNPGENLVAARRLLRDDGTLIVQVPNADSYQARIFRGDWFALDAPRHRYHFNISNLRLLLETAGFMPYRVSFFSRTHNSHSLRQSLKGKWLRSSKPLKILAFYLSIPFLRPIDFMMSALGSGATMTLAARATQINRS